MSYLAFPGQGAAEILSLLFALTVTCPPLSSWHFVLLVPRDGLQPEDFFNFFLF